MVPTSPLLPALEQLGLRPSAEWLAATLRELRIELSPTPTPAAVESAAQLVFDAALHTELRVVVGAIGHRSSHGRPALPPDLKSHVATTLKGPLFLQLDEWVDVGPNATEDAPNATEDAPNSATASTYGRMLKLAITDGHQTTAAIELAPLPDLRHGVTKAGAKIALRGDVEVRRGMILLSPSNCRVLGGFVPALVKLQESLSAARSSMGKAPDSSTAAAAAASLTGQSDGQSHLPSDPAASHGASLSRVAPSVSPAAAFDENDIFLADEDELMSGIAPTAVSSTDSSSATHLGYEPMLHQGLSSSSLTSSARTVGSGTQTNNTSDPFASSRGGSSSFIEHEPSEGGLGAELAVLTPPGAPGPSTAAAAAAVCNAATTAAAKAPSASGHKQQQQQQQPSSQSTPRAPSIPPPSLRNTTGPSDIYELCSDDENSEGDDDGELGRDFQPSLALSSRPPAYYTLSQLATLPPASRGSLRGVQVTGRMMELQGLNFAVEDPSAFSLDIPAQVEDSGGVCAATVDGNLVSRRLGGLSSRDVFHRVTSKELPKEQRSTIRKTLKALLEQWCAFEGIFVCDVVNSPGVAGASSGSAASVGFSLLVRDLLP